MSEFRELQAAPAEQLESYIPEYTPISDEAIDDYLKLYSAQPVYDNRNFPGQSKPSPDQKGKPFSPLMPGEMGMRAGMKLAQGEPTAQVIGELIGDLFDFGKRPMKAVFGAVDAAMEQSQDVIRTNPSTMARMITGAFLPQVTAVKSAQGFIEGLYGERGAAEVLHRLGVKNAKEKLSPEAYQEYQDELAEKLEGKGFISQVATQVVDDFVNNPLDFWSDLAEYPTNIPGVGPAVGMLTKPITAPIGKAIGKGAKLAMSAGERGVVESMRLGAKVSKHIQKKLGEDFPEFMKIVGHGEQGIHKFMEQMKTASASLQSKFQNIIKKNPKFNIEPLALEHRLVEETEFMSKMEKLFPVVLNKEGSKKAKMLYKQGKRDEAIDLFMQSRRSAHIQKTIMDKTEDGLATLSRMSPDKTMMEAPYWAAERAFDVLKQVKPGIKYKDFAMMTTEEVFNKLPAQFGKLGRTQVNIGKVLSDPKIGEIFKKPLTDMSVDDMKYVLDKYATIIPREKLQGIFDANKIPTYGRNPSFFNDPIGWGRMNASKYVYEEAGLASEFFWPRVYTSEIEHKGMKESQNNLMKALAPLNGGGEILKIKKADLRRYGQFLDTGDLSLLKNKTEEVAMARVRKEFDRLWNMLPDEVKFLPSGQKRYIKDYLPHIIKKLEKNGMAVRNNLDFNPSVTLGNLKQRQGAMGYETDLVEVFDTYTKAVHRYVHRRPVVNAMKKQLNGMSLSDDFKRFVEQDIAKFAGQAHDDKFIEMLANGLMKTPIPKMMGLSQDMTREALAKINYNLLQVGYLTGMGLNFRLPIRNLATGAPMVIPRASKEAFFSAHKDLAGLLSNAGDPEMKALNGLLQNSKLYASRVGDLKQMMPDIGGYQNSYANPIEALTKKAIHVTGFSQSEKYLVASTIATGLRDQMNRMGIKTYQALLKHPKRDKIIQWAEKLTADTQNIYNRYARPQWMQNHLGSHLMQYGTFGLNAGNLALRDLMWNSQRENFLKSSLSAALVAGSMNAAGLSGMGYAAYFGAVEPLRQAYALAGGDPEKAVKGPALKAGIGLSKMGVGALSGSKTLSKEGERALKGSFNLAVKNQATEAWRFKDPSRMFLYKQYPKRKKR